MVYSFRYMVDDPGSAFASAGAEVIERRRSGVEVKTWRVTTTGGEDSAAVISALQATGLLVGQVTVEPA